MKGGRRTPCRRFSNMSIRRHGVRRSPKKDHCLIPALDLQCLTSDEKQHDAGRFEILGLCQPVLDAIARQGWPEPTPIQREAIPVVLSGQDLFGVAQTGTGKTAAFALPILHQLSQQPPAEPLKPYCVVLAPTRELVQQIADQFELLARDLSLRILIAHGGTSDRPQTSALAAGVEIIVGAPGRVFDLMKQGYLQYAALRYCVLDEADRMFDMGFIDEIRNILNRMPARRQTLMFSATLPQAVKKLAADYLFYPEEIRIGTTGPPKELNHEAWPVRSDRDKEQALRELLDQEHECVLVFCRTKLGASQLARMLSRWGEKVASIHGDRMQSERERALESFREGRVRVLVGTDVASRGLDIEGIDLVLNYDTPRDPEDYVHRVGRTARAKRSGIAVTFVLPDEARALKRIEQFIKASVPRRGGEGRGSRDNGGGSGNDTGDGSGAGANRESRNHHSSTAKSGGKSRKQSAATGSHSQRGGSSAGKQDGGREGARNVEERSGGERGSGERDARKRAGDQTGETGASEQPRKRRSRGGRGRKRSGGEGGGTGGAVDSRDSAQQAPERQSGSKPGTQHADDDSTYVEDDAYAPSSTFNVDPGPPGDTPPKRRRGKRGGRGRKRDGDSTPPD